MKLLATILTAPVSVPLLGVGWVADEILDAARRQYYDIDSIRRELEEVNRALDAGEIDAAEFEEREAAILDRLEEAQAWHATASEEVD
ncbi:MAG: gas vesicle protein [Polyangiaceae bacterium]|nr:gas vesicle protein [Polyangiaceae bacterium]